MGLDRGYGICHSYAPDGRCIRCSRSCSPTSPVRLPVLREPRDQQRPARASRSMMVRAHAGFLPPQCVEGLFLSSGIIQSPDYTMEQVVEWPACCCEEHDFRGYIHPQDHPRRIARADAAQAAMRTACPSTSSCPRPRASRPWRPRKTAPPSTGPWPAWLCTLVNHARHVKSKPRRPSCRCRNRAPRAGPARRCFAPGGQSTQMIVGADATDDHTILATSARLYGVHRLRRRVLLGLQPHPRRRRALPLAAPPTVRAPAVPGRLADALLWLHP